jgi:hypothetical protein
MSDYRGADRARRAGEDFTVRLVYVAVAVACAVALILSEVAG